jgi:uncharacterized protein
MKPLCIFHSNCADGFGAAWVVRKALGESNVEFLAGVYQQEPPPTKDRYVIMVDFSYKREVLLKLASTSLGVLLLDHHKSAMEDIVPDGNYIIDLNKYTGKLNWNRFLENCAQDVIENCSYGRVYSLFNLNQSGASITWDFFFGNKQPPRLIEHIEDRDLWKFQLENTRKIQAALFSYPYDFVVWDQLMKEEAILGLAMEGSAIERKHFKDIEELVKVCMYWTDIGGFSVPVANLPYTLTSDAGNLMATNFAPTCFSACFWNTKHGRTFSLRSIPGGMDVSKVAEEYGGGGHEHAAGFSVGIGDPLYRI